MLLSHKHENFQFTQATFNLVSYWYCRHVASGWGGGGRGAALPTTFSGSKHFSYIKSEIKKFLTNPHFFIHKKWSKKNKNNSKMELKHVGTIHYIPTTYPPPPQRIRIFMILRSFFLILLFACQDFLMSLSPTFKNDEKCLYCHRSIIWAHLVNSM